MVLQRLLTLSLFCAHLATAARLTVSIQPSPQLLNPSTLVASTHAVLLGPPGTRYDSHLTRNNTFLFPDLPESSYLLTIHSREYFFQPLRVDVAPAEEAGAQQTITAWQTFRGNEWSNKGPSYGAGAGELEVQMRTTLSKDFYQERAGFNLIAFFKSPMILMALFSVVLIFVMPYMMDNMDEETRAEMEEMASKQPLTGGGAASSIQNFDLAGWMAGKSSGSSSPGTNTPTSGGGGAKRR